VRTHGRLQADFAARLGLPRVLTDALGQSYERWDKKGSSRGCARSAAKLGFTLLDEVEFEFPPGNFAASNDWRLDLTA